MAKYNELAQTITLSEILLQQIKQIQMEQILYRLREISQGGQKMSYSNLDVIDMMTRHVQNLRSSLSGEPSPTALAAWRMEDVRNEQVRESYIQQEEADDNFTFSFSSEVNPK